MHRVSAIITILLFLQATVNSFGWYCVPMSAECCPVVAANCDAGAAESSAICSFTCPLERIAEASEAKAPCASSCGNGCGASEEAKSASREEMSKSAPCQAARSEKFPTLFRACAMPDNTECVERVCVPPSCKPVRCIILHPLLADSPPKAPSPVISKAIESPNQPLLALSMPRAGPTLTQVWGINPIIQTTVLRI